MLAVLCTSFIQGVGWAPGATAVLGCAAYVYCRLCLPVLDCTAPAELAIAVVMYQDASLQNTSQFTNASANLCCLCWYVLT